MKRDPALIPLSHDHQNTLARALRLRRAADGDQRERAEAITAFVEFVDARVLAHFAEEEALLDQLERRARSCPDEVTRASARMREQHDELRTRFEALRSAASDGRPVDEASMRETGQLLTDHVRFEERELFELLQQTWGDRLAELVAP